MIHAALLARGGKRSYPLWFLIIRVTAILFMLVVLIYSECHRRAFRQACGYGGDLKKFYIPACQAYYKDIK